jgi:hypothetical protein
MPEIERALRKTIRQRLQDGTLPRVKPSATWGGPGAGRACSACGRTISNDEMEFEVEFALWEPASRVLRSESQMLYLHATCFAAWELEQEPWLRANPTAISRRARGPH